MCTPSNNTSSLEPAQLLRLVLDTIPQCVFWKDVNSKYLGCNQLFADTAGLDSPDRITGLTDFDLPWTDEQAQFYQLCDQRVMSRDEPETGIVESQTNANGELTWLETSKVPLRDSSGNVIGVLGSFHDITKIKEAEQSLQRDNDLLEKRVKDRTKELSHMAQHDSLTGLANREFFMHQLDQVVHSGKPFALLFIDLDRFKSFNDSLGHGAGDKLLVQVSKVLKWVVRGTDIVGRFGGDEFTILLQDIRTIDEVNQVSDCIQAELGKKIVVGEFEHVVSASIGFVTDLEHEYQSASDVLRDADIAMYEAKRAGKACHRMFSNEMLENISEKIALEQRLRNGLGNGEIFTVYQPILDLASGKLRGFEALVRWLCSERGLVSPAEFLPLAEEAGLIVEVGEQVVRQSCKQLQIWKELHPGLDISVSVNFSASQLLCDGCLDFLDATLAVHRLEPCDINIEITESMILDEHRAVESVLTTLSKRGHKLMLDDFGTGYSSLSYLHRYPIDTLKIDRSFVQAVESDRNSQAIVKTMVGLANFLEMEVIAEGVETGVQEKCLIEMGCAKMQGYRYAKPMSAANASDYLSRYQPQQQSKVKETIC